MRGLYGSFAPLVPTAGFPGLVRAFIAGMHAARAPKLGELIDLAAYRRRRQASKANNPLDGKKLEV